MKHSAWKEPKVILSLKYKNGTIIPELGYDNTQITQEQISYFDDYYNRREAYYQNKNYWQQQDIADWLDSMSQQS